MAVPESGVHLKFAFQTDGGVVVFKIFLIFVVCLQFTGQCFFLSIDNGWKKNNLDHHKQWIEGFCEDCLHIIHFITMQTQLLACCCLTGLATAIYTVTSVSTIT